MKSFKRIIALMLALLLILPVFAACKPGSSSGGKSGGDDDGDETPKTVGYKDPLECAQKAIEAYFTGKPETLFQMMPEGTIEYWFSQHGITNKAEIKTRVSNWCKAMNKKANEMAVTYYGADLISEEDYSQEELWEIEEDFDVAKIDEGKLIDLRVKYKVNGEREDEGVHFPVIRIGDLWYVSPELLEEFRSTLLSDEYSGAHSDTVATAEPDMSGEEPGPTSEPVPAQPTGEYRVALITDYGDITDQSFNQTTHEACEKFCKDNNINYKYFKPATASTQDRVAQIKAAINEGYDVIVLPGYAFGEAIYEVQDSYPGVKFIALDVAEFDVEDAFYNHDDYYNRTDLKNSNNPPHLGSNVYCTTYREEYAGFMAGYAAVKLGYRRLGFLGAMPVPAIIRYGFGFVQGCDAAARELGIANEVSVNYIYANTFGPNDAIKAKMDDWFMNGTEVVFACGGAIYVSAVAAAKDANAKIIGVDVDQKGIIDGIGGAGMTVTSAMKGLAATVTNVLNETVKNNKWDALFGGRYETLGLVSGDDPTLNYLQLPMESTQWNGSFTRDDYRELVRKLYNGTLSVSDDISRMPNVSITFNDQGSIW